MVDVARVLYSVSTISKVLLSLVMHSYSLFDPLSPGRRGKCERVVHILIWPLRPLGSAYLFSKSSTRFVAAYLKRNRTRAPRLGTHQFQPLRSRMSTDTLRDLELGDSSGAKSQYTDVEVLRETEKVDHSSCRTCLQPTTSISLGRPDKIVKKIAIELHASDIRCLGQVSRGIRASLYAHNGAYSHSNNNLMEASVYALQRCESSR